MGIGTRPSWVPGAACFRYFVKSRHLVLSDRLTVLGGIFFYWKRSFPCLFSLIVFEYVPYTPATVKTVFEYVAYTPAYWHSAVSELICRVPKELLVGLSKWRHDRHVVGC